MAPRLPEIQISKRAVPRLQRGHLWVFSNEVDHEGPGVEEAREVAVLGPEREFLGVAVYNRQALVRARLYNYKSVPFDEDLIRTRVAAAQDRRARLLPGRQCYRAVASETDGVPGLIVDRYGEYLAVQFQTAAVDAYREMIPELLEEQFRPKAIVERGDSSTRANEGLSRQKQVLRGELPDKISVDVDGLQFLVDLIEGPGTGLFLDQLENWRLMDWLAPGRKVLDLFCGTGGFSLRAQAAGAVSVRAIDSSGGALSQLLFNTRANHLDQVRAKEADGFQYVRAQPELFDVIVCDPPPQAWSRKQKETALRRYRELTRYCLRMLNPGGVLVACSRSAALTEQDFEKMLSFAGSDAERVLRLLPGGAPPADHAPVLAMPETRYLKVRVVEAMD